MFQSMYLSNYFVKTQKENPSYEQSVNAKLLIRAGFVNQLMAGVYTYLPFGLRVLRKVENIIREEMENLGGLEVFMPSLHAKRNWEQTGRRETYDVLFKFISYYTNIDYAMGPTHEEVVTPLMKDYILSYKDLPAYVFQIQNKFRDELRSKSGLLRGREFGMKDLYSFHTDKQDLDEYYDKVIQGYHNIFRKVGIGDKTYLTYAYGGTFSKYSHEFQTESSGGEDFIHICQECKVAMNKELTEEQKTCPNCGAEEFEEKKSIEVGNIFKLGTKFTEDFDFKFTDKDGEEYSVIMGCYGIGTGRLMGAIVEVSHDENGMIWPESVAPFKYVIIPIGENGYEKGKEVYEYLRNRGEEVVIDDRNQSPGFKFKDADLIGYPYQIVVSDKTLQQGENMVEVKTRASGEKNILDFKNI